MLKIIRLIHVKIESTHKNRYFSSLPLVEWLAISVFFSPSENNSAIIMPFWRFRICCLWENEMKSIWENILLSSLRSTSATENLLQNYHLFKWMVRAQRAEPFLNESFHKNHIAENCLCRQTRAGRAGQRCLAWFRFFFSFGQMKFLEWLRTIELFRDVIYFFFFALLFGVCFGFIFCN